jgi:hypothetical protein
VCLDDCLFSFKFCFFCTNTQVETVIICFEFLLFHPTLYLTHFPMVRTSRDALRCVVTNKSRRLQQ